MKNVEIIIPQYPTQIKTSNRRRATYYKKENAIPLKYQNNNYVFNNKGVLIEAATKKPVIKNSRSVNTPRYITIGGNLIYSGIHERVRIKIMNSIKTYFKKHIPNIKLKDTLKLPLEVTMEVHRPIDNGNWDIDNFAIIYIKAFFDSIVDKKLIDDDNIKNIISVKTKYVPITNEDDRRLVFIINSTDDDIFKTHLFYNEPDKEIRSEPDKNLEYYNLIIDSDLKTGQLLINDSNKSYSIGIGKKHIIWNALNKTLTSIAIHCLQKNVGVTVTKNVSSHLKAPITNILLNKGIPVAVNNLKESIKTNILLINSI
jgi:hypothetical protein